MSNVLPPPPDMGLPEKFSSWRRLQDHLVVDAMESLIDRRFLVIEAATGTGKSLSYTSVAHLSGGRWVILTSTKGLQTQLMDDFESLGIVDVRGQSNYDCLYLFDAGQSGNCESAPCHAGMTCGYRDRGCLYFDAVRKAKSAKIVVTNYSFWLAYNYYTEEGLGSFDGIVLDEAHDAPDEVSGFLSIELLPADFDIFNCKHPTVDDGIPAWQSWAMERLLPVSMEVERLKQLIAGGDAPRADQRRFKDLRRVLTKLQRITSLSGKWILDRAGQAGVNAVKFDPLWPGPYCEQLLFRGIPKVILSSATVRPKTLSQMNIPPEEMKYFEVPSVFPVGRRPVYYLPSVRVKHSWTEEDRKWWGVKIDQIVGSRLDRKGIIHTGSYDRRTWIMENSKHRGVMMSNTTRSTVAAVEEFKKSLPPKVFVSPSVTTGYDFPYTDCEYQILAKVPFPDTRSKITKARCDDDPEYGPYLAMQTIVQSCGRGMRAADDACESFIVDGMFGWFHKQYRVFAPGWWNMSVRVIDQIPPALPKLK